MKKQRKHYAPEEKVAILRRHLLEKEPISKLCDEVELQPTVFYRWQKEFFENGAAAFEQKARPNQCHWLHHAEGTWLPGVSRRSMPSGIESWRRRENSGRFFGSRLRRTKRPRFLHPCSFTGGDLLLLVSDAMVGSLKPHYSVRAVPSPTLHEPPSGRSRLHLWGQAVERPAM